MNFQDNLARERTKSNKMNFVKKIMKTSWLVTKDTFWVTIFGMFISLIFTGITLYLMKENYINGRKEDLCGGPSSMIERFCDNDEECIVDILSGRANFQ